MKSFVASALTLALASSASAFKVSFFSDSSCETSFMSHCSDCGRLNIASQNIATTIDHVVPDQFELREAGASEASLEAWTTASVNVKDDIKTLSISTPTDTCLTSGVTAGEDGTGDLDRSVTLNVDLDSFGIDLYKGSKSCSEEAEKFSFITELIPVQETSIGGASGFSSLCTETDSAFIQEWFQSFHLTSAYSSTYKDSDIEAAMAFFEGAESSAYMLVELTTPENDLVQLDGTNAVEGNLNGHWVEAAVASEMVANNFKIA